MWRKGSIHGWTGQNLRHELSGYVNGAHCCLGRNSSLVLICIVEFKHGSSVAGPTVSHTASTDFTGLRSPSQTSLELTGERRRRKKKENNQGSQHTMFSWIIFPPRSQLGLKGCHRRFSDLFSWRGRKYQNVTGCRIWQTVHKGNW